MKQITIWIFALCFYIVIRHSSASNDVKIIADTPCTRNDGNPGYCMRPRKCPQLIPLLRARKTNILTPQQINDIHNSGSRNCTNEKQICCAYQKEREGIKQLLDQECGSFGTSKIFGGHIVNLMSRPWLALLNLYSYEEKITRFKCGGTLIHKRFVLTAAHCFQNHKLISVRLGEHNVSSVEDCQFLRGKRRCAPPVEDIEVDEIYTYNVFNASQRINDIALVKLARDVEFKEHIKPICLPINETLQQKVTEIERFIVTGWGETEKSNSSDVPLEAQVSKAPAYWCKIKFRQIISSQLCVGQNGRDSGQGDSGGPLADIQFYQEAQRFVQYGIVSYGSDLGVYTNVSMFMPWIADKIATNYVV